MSAGMAGAGFAMAALIPMMTGPLPSEERSVMIALCAGGAIEIPLGDGDKAPGHDCPAAGCHAGATREKLKTRLN
ncbi:MAG: hypothetical protein AAF127_08585 [Pseudomonadota bacterium]